MWDYYYDYEEIPILDAALRCNLPIRPGSSGRIETEAACFFCGDHGPNKYHLSMNTLKNVFRCNLCGARGNSVTLYASYFKISNREAYDALTTGASPYQREVQECRKNLERLDPPPAPLERRHEVYGDFLRMLSLSTRHRNDLLRRGLSPEAIESNGYRSLPRDWRERRKIAGELSKRHDLHGIPGFYTREGQWSIAGWSGILIPYGTKENRIQGLQIRLDGEDLARHTDLNKYQWFASRGRENGTRSGSYLHVTGDITRKKAYLTEGALKGDAASDLSGGELFVCFAGVNAADGLADVLLELGVGDAAEAIDMDKRSNWLVRKALCKIRSEIERAGLQHSVCNWTGCNAIDDYLLLQPAA